MKKSSRVFSLFLALMLCVSLLPVGAAALEMEPSILQNVVEAVEEASAAETAPVLESGDGADLVDSLDAYKDYVIFYVNAGAPTEDEAERVAAEIRACETYEQIASHVIVSILLNNEVILSYDEWLSASCPEPELPETGDADNAEDIVLYSTMSQNDLDALVTCFNAVYPNIKISIVNGSIGELVARLREEKSAPAADVVWGGLSASDGDSYADVFESWVSENDAQNMAGYTSPNGLYSVTHLSTVVFCVNTELEEELGLEIDSYEDLLNPMLDEQITTADPNVFNSAWNNLCNIITVYGNSDAGWEYIESLMPNLVMLGSSTQVFRQVQQGEYVVGLTYEDGAVTLLKNGADNVKLVYPSEGTSAAGYGAALVKGAPHEENAKLLIDFLCSAEGQTAMATYQGGTLRFANKDYEMPENSHLPASDDIKWIVRDEAYLAENKASIIEHWNALWTGINEPVLIDETNFPDDNFRSYVSENCDTNGDGYLSTDEISEVWWIDCSGMDIESLQGIEYFTNLNNLSCENNKLSSLDIDSLENLEYLSFDEEAIGGINLTATEDGYTADLTVVSHLIDSSWEIGAGKVEQEPTIASVYDTATGMATFASRPKVITFGVLESYDWGEFWDAHIEIYVSDADLPKLVAPTDLQWGVEYERQWDEETGELIDVPKGHPGMMSWLNAENAGMSYELHLVVYRDTEAGFQVTGSMRREGQYISAAYESSDYFIENTFLGDNPETGDYYFTVQYVGDGQTCADSEVVKSELFHYTKPDTALRGCGTPYWTEEGGITWSGPEEDEFFDYYVVYVFHSKTEDGEPQITCSTSGRTNGAAGFEEINFMVDEYGYGYYSIRVHAISSDITQCCNSEWSELSEPRYFSGEETPEDLPVGDIDGDGYVLANDLVSLMKSLVSGEVDAATNPDINKDGNVDVLDVIRLIRMMAGLV